MRGPEPGWWTWDGVAGPQAAAAAAAIEQAIPEQTLKMSRNLGQAMELQAASGRGRVFGDSVLPQTQSQGAEPRMDADG